MKTFKNIVLVKHPKPLVWASIRDYLTELVPHLTDVASIEERERSVVADGVVKLTNVWTADVALPAMVSGLVNSSNLGWTDRASWHDDSGVCQWEIEPHFLSNALRCQGKALYETAMGGRGTKITFEGEFSLLPGQNPALPAFVEKSASDTIETLVGTLIAKNFRKVTDALTQLLLESKLNTLEKRQDKTCEIA